MHGSSREKSTEIYSFCFLVSYSPVVLFVLQCFLTEALSSEIMSGEANTGWVDSLLAGAGSLTRSLFTSAAI
jgi:hypothetical protein